VCERASVERRAAGFTYDRMLHTMPDDAYDIIMKIHVRAPFRLIRAAAPYMRFKGLPPCPSAHPAPG
jgi:NAD(P)-dependent dehydrogenase (short-subunit alcohol dehydrogenase family)